MKKTFNEFELFFLLNHYENISEKYHEKIASGELELTPILIRLFSSYRENVGLLLEKISEFTDADEDAFLIWRDKWLSWSETVEDWDKIGLALELGDSTDHFLPPWASSKKVSLEFSPHIEC